MAQISKFPLPDVGEGLTEAEMVSFPAHLREQLASYWCRLVRQ
jgi:hypothetical protein